MGTIIYSPKTVIEVGVKQIGYSFLLRFIYQKRNS